MNSWEPKFTDRPDWRDLGWWLAIPVAVVAAVVILAAGAAYLMGAF